MVDYNMVGNRKQLAEEQHRRRCVDAQLDHEAPAPSRDARVREALAVCGKYREPAGETNVARDHDRHLDEAYRLRGVSGR